jgi:hypothetical protein
LLLNGDGLFDVNLLDLAHPLASDVMERMALRVMSNADRHGTLTLNGDGTTAFGEKGVRELTGSDQ